MGKEEFSKIKKELSSLMERVKRGDTLTAEDSDLILNMAEVIKFFSKEPFGESFFMDGKISRNKPCYCGSGKKYKHCCGKH